MIEAGTQIGLEYHEDVNHLPPGAGDNIGWYSRPAAAADTECGADLFARG